MKLTTRNIAGARLNSKKVLKIGVNGQIIYPYVARSNYNIFTVTVSADSGGFIRLDVSDNDNVICHNDRSVYVDWGDGSTSSNFTYHYYKEPGTYIIKTNCFFNTYQNEESIYSEYTPIVNLISLRYDMKNMNYLLSNSTRMVSADLNYYDTSQMTRMDYLFYNCSALETVKMARWDTSNVVDMNHMFYGCESLMDLDVSEFSTSNVEDMSSMFSGCSNLIKLDVTNFDTRKVTDMSSMFYNCNNLKALDVSDFYTSKVTDMRNMFQNCSRLTELDVSNFDTSNVTNMSSMFRSCLRLTNLNLEHLDTSNVEYMYAMFQNCQSLTKIDLRHFETNSLLNTSYMFDGCINLVEVNLSNWNTSNTTNMYGMFQNCENITRIDLSGFDTSKVSDMRSMFKGCKNLKVLDLRNFKFDTIDDVGDSSRVKDFFTGCENLQELRLDNCDSTVPWLLLYYADAGQNPTNPVNFPTGDLFDSEGNKIPRIIYCKTSSAIYPCPDGWQYVFVDAIEPGGVYQQGQYTNRTDLTEVDVIVNSTHTDLSYMFSGCTELTTINGMNTWDTSNVTAMNSMFNRCESLMDLDVSNLNTSKVENMNFMFSGCDNIGSLDLSNFDVSNTVYMQGMFSLCSNLTSLDLSGWTTDKIYDMCSMFQFCESLIEIDLSGFSPTKMWGLNNTFSGCTNLEKIDLSNFKITDEGWEDVRGAFRNCVKLHELRLDNCDNVTIKKLVNSLDFPTGTVDGRTRKIYCKEENTFDPDNPNTRIVLPDGWAFEYDLSKEPEDPIIPEDAIAIPDVPRIPRTPATAPEGATVYSSGEYEEDDTLIEANTLVTSAHTDLEYMFWNCEHLITVYNIEEWDTSNVTSMGQMFQNCYSLRAIDLSSLDTSNVTNMTNMFYECSSFTILDLSNWDTSNVEHMYGMFAYCFDLVYLDLRNWDTSNVVNMSDMFRSCYNLHTIRLDDFNLGSETLVYDMFSGCDNLVALRLDNCNNATIDKIINSSNFPTGLVEGKVRKIYCTQENRGNLEPPLGWEFVYYLEDEPVIPEEEVQEPIVLPEGATLYTSREYMGNSQMPEVNTFVCSDHTDLSWMFYGCSVLRTIHNIEQWDTSNVVTMQCMFSGCTSLKIFDISNFTTRKLKYVSSMFSECESLEEIDLSNWSVSNITDMGGMFDGCINLKSVNLSGWKTKRVTHVSSMFSDCTSLTSLDLSSFDISNVDETRLMFNNCTSLEELDISNFNMASVTEYGEYFMLDGCENLRILKLNNCPYTTINRIINSLGFPVNALEGVTRKIYVNPDNIGDLTPPENWVFVNCLTDEEIVTN